MNNFDGFMGTAYLSAGSKASGNAYAISIDYMHACITCIHQLNVK